jgi:hypothetical protein
MKSKKSVPQKFMQRPTVQAFQRMIKESLPGEGRQKKASRIHKRKTNKHGRQHP